MTMTSISDDDEAELVERLGRDVVATLGPGLLDVVRSAARHHRRFMDDRGEYFERVVDEVQQHVHDCFIDTSWPSCPVHPNHPVWFVGGYWVADGAVLARLGELASAAHG